MPGIISSQPITMPPGATSWPQPRSTSTPELINQTSAQIGGLTSVAKDVFQQGNGIIQNVPKGDLVQFTTQESQEAPKKSNSKRNSAITVAILLIGGAALGYGHRNQISKGLNSAKSWLNSGKTGEWITKGKGLLTKAKDAIMTKPPVA